MKDHYPIENFPSLWENISQLNQTKIGLISEYVKMELGKKEDDLFDWTKKNICFVPIDEELQKKGAEILNVYPGLIDHSSTKNKADPFVIALAKIKGLKVVTEEKRKNQNIPNVCSYLSVKSTNLLGLISEQKWRF